MELYLDEILYVLENAPDTVAQDIRIREMIRELACYYENGQWLSDYELDENGKLKAYDRETLVYGNGIDTPYRKVIETVSMNQKLVYVTLKYEGVEALLDNEYFVPRLCLVEKDGEKMYLAGNNYKRPMNMEEIICNGFPCYFEETKGGENFNFTDLKDGNVTMHIAYLVDEDMMDGMLLSVEPWHCTSGNESLSDENVYIDISQ